MLSLLKKSKEAGCFSRPNAIGGFEGSDIFPLNVDKIMTKYETTCVPIAPENGDQEEGNSSMASPANTHGLRSKALTPQITTLNLAAMPPKRSLELSISSAKSVYALYSA